MKMMLLDVENFPHLGWSHDVYDATLFKIVRPKLICAISWQWYPELEVHTIALPDYPDYDREAWARGDWALPDSKVWSNRLMMEHFAPELAQADVLIAHNLKRHDLRLINTAIGVNDIRMTTPQLMIDTLTPLKTRFAFAKNGLGYVCEELGIGKKLDSAGLWEGCLRGDMNAWKEYKTYNAHDVHPLLRGLYEFERPWIRNHPNLNLTSTTEGCPKCGSVLAPRSDGWRFTAAGKYQRLKCRACYAPIQGVLDKEGKLTYRSL